MMMNQKKKSTASRLLNKWWREPTRRMRLTMREPALLAHMVRAMATKQGGEKSGEIRLSLLCPTRNRPDKMARMWKSAVETAAHPDSVEIVFYLDNDDVAGMCGLRLAAGVRPQQVRAVVGGRITLSQCWNAAAEIARGNIFMYCGDDIIFRSAGWDVIVAEKMAAFDDRIVFVYGRDGIQDEKLGTHFFITREWARVTGYVVPPMFPNIYSDTWVNEVAERIGRKIYAPDIYTEHMHFVAGKSARDRTYHERIETHREHNEDELWRQTEHLRIADAEKLAAHIAKHKKEKGEQK